MQWPQPGYNHTPAYQTSGLPYLTSSSGVNHLVFPMVTKFITVGATSGDTKFAFTANGLVSTNNFTVLNGETVIFDFRVKEMWVSGAGYSIAAGLTGIPTASIPTLTGSYPWNSSDPYFTGSNGHVSVITYDGLG